MSEDIILETNKDVGTLVGRYAKRLTSDERAEQFAAHVSLMATSDSKIANADKKSLMAAMMACVHLDLMPNTPEQHAFLIPYFNKANNITVVQFQVGYRGLVKMALRSGLIKAMNAELVFKQDKFDVGLGTARKLIHKPNFDIDRTDYSLVTHAYATAVLANGERVFEVMTRKELDKIQESAKAKSTASPWVNWPNEMAKKTVIKRATKLLPSSTDDQNIASAAMYDSWAEAGLLKLNKEGDLIQGKVDENAAKEERKNRIKLAENTRKELEATNHKPKPVKVQEPKKEKK